MRHGKLGIAAATALLLGTFGFAGGAQAATITPDIAFDEFTLDDGECSLREAVVSANDNADLGGCTTGDQVEGGYGDDTIVLEATNYVLTVVGTGENDGLTGDLDVEGPLTVRGPTDADGVIGTALNDRIFDLRTAAAQLTVQDLVIAGGESGGSGGNISAATAGNDVVLTRATVTEGEALIGGGIAVAGNGSTLTATDSVIEDNEATSSGGGLHIGGSAGAALTRVSVSLNDATTASASGQVSGGGIAIQSGGPEVSITDSALEGNSAAATAGDADWGLGGGVYTLRDLRVDGSLFANNEASAGGPNTSEEHGGAIHVANPGAAEVVNSTFFSNDVGDGSAADEDARGGALYKTGGGLDVSFSTFFQNTTTNDEFAASVDNGNSGSNTTITASVFPSGSNTCEGNAIVSGGFNVASSDADCNFVGTDDIAGTASGIVLGNPQDNGGPTPTFGLLPTSRAIDQVPFAECGPAGGVDARDYPRQGSAVGAGCDSGAYERTVCNGAVQNTDFVACPIPAGPATTPPATAPPQPVKKKKKCKKAKKKKGKKAAKKCGKKKKKKGRK